MRNRTPLDVNRSTRLDGIIGGLKAVGRYSIGPCPFCGGRDRFNVKHTDDGDLWICRQCGDGKYQDAIAYLMRRDGLTFGEVVGRLKLGDWQGSSDYPTMSPVVSASKSETSRPPDEEWQRAALAAVGEAAHYLNVSENDDARMAWRYLRQQRGLLPDTISTATIGFNPAWRRVNGRDWLAPGITIPAMADGQLWYVQVRTTKAARRAAEAKGRPLGKYHALGGSRLKALFNADALLSAHTAIVTEGEFDTLLLSQYLPKGMAAVTMGSAGTMPGPEFVRYFAAVQWAFLVMDADAAGQAGLVHWQELLGWAEATPSLADGSKDITEHWRSGGDLNVWLASFLNQPERDACHE